MQFHQSIRLTAVLISEICFAAVSTRDEVWKQHMDAGRSLCERGRYEEALKEFRLAEEQVRDSTALSLHLAVTSNFTGAALNRLGDLAGAEQRFRQGAHLLEKTTGVHRQYYAVTLANLADVLLTRGEPARAHRTVQRALEILDETGMAGDDMARSPMWETLGRLAVMRHEYAEAHQWLELSLASLEKGGKLGSTAALQVREDLVDLARAEGNHALELQLARQSARDFEAAYGPTHPEVANSYNLVAVAHLALGQKKEACLAIEHAVEIARLSLPPDHPLLGRLLGNYVVLMKGTEENRKLKQLSSQARTILTEYARRNRTWSVDAGDAAYLPRH